MIYLQERKGGTRYLSIYHVVEYIYDLFVGLYVIVKSAQNICSSFSLKMSDILWSDYETDAKHILIIFCLLCMVAYEYTLLPNLAKGD